MFASRPAKECRKWCRKANSSGFCRAGFGRISCPIVSSRVTYLLLLTSSTEYIWFLGAVTSSGHADYDVPCRENQLSKHVAKTTWLLEELEKMRSVESTTSFCSVITWWLPEFLHIKKILNTGTYCIGCRLGFNQRKTRLDVNIQSLY
jgi:hypothetical protein